MDIWILVLILAFQFSRKNEEPPALRTKLPHRFLLNWNLHNIPKRLNYKTGYENHEQFKRSAIDPPLSRRR